MTSHAEKLRKKKRYEWTREAVIEAAQGFYRRRGRSPSSREMRRENGLPWLGTVKKTFGTHNAMLAAAGLPVRLHTKTSREKVPVDEIRLPERGVRSNAEWPREQIIAVIQQTYAKYGRMPPPSPTPTGFPSRKAIRRVFGTYGNALREAGVPRERRMGHPRGPYPPSKTAWKKEEALDAMRAYHKAHGRLPRGPERRQPEPHMPSRSVYVRLFGTWNNAVKAAGFEPIKPYGSKPGRVYKKSDREPRPNPKEFQGWRFDNRKGEKSNLKEKERRRSENAVQHLSEE